MQNSKRPIWRWLVTIVAIGFGVLTIKSGGSVLFIDGEARQAAGHYVGFVLWFNFVAGFFYTLAGLGFWFGSNWAKSLAMIIAGTTLLIFVAFGIHILNGGAYEMRTVMAMSLRSIVWIAIAVTAFLLDKDTTK